MSKLLIAFYSWWHGRLHLKGAGWLLTLLAPRLSGLRNFPLKVKGIGIVPIDLSDGSGMAWINYSLREGSREDAMIACIKALLPSPKCLWDVGANGGYFAAKLIAEFPGLESLYLFEPNAKMHSTLAPVATARAGVHLRPIALSDTVGIATFFKPPGDGSTASLIASDACNEEFVLTATADFFLEKHPESKPDLVIIDMEGAEPMVLKGMVQLLREYLPIIFFGQQFFDPKILDEYFPAGYKRYTIDDHTGEILPGFFPEQGRNGVCIPPRLNG
jgi:FkbM family methyltransferase